MIKILNKHTSHLVPLKKSISDISYLLPGQSCEVKTLEEILNFSSIKQFLNITEEHRISNEKIVDKKKK